MPNLRNHAEKNKMINLYSSLRLSWIYGISYTQCPAMQFAVHDAQFENTNIVYCSGNAVISYNYFTHEQQYYLNHKEIINAVTVSSKGEFVASAEYFNKRAIIHIWNLRTMENISYITTMQKGPILAMEFMFEDKYLLAIGKDSPHALLIYEWNSKILELTSIVFFWGL